MSIVFSPDFSIQADPVKYGDEIMLSDVAGQVKSLLIVYLIACSCYVWFFSYF